MIATLGYLSILAALVGAIGISVRGFVAMRDPNRATAKYLGLPVVVFFSGAIAAMFFLELGLLTDDFSVKYIANNSSTSTPVLFKFASAWASLEGSIVLWGLVLAAFTYGVYYQFFRRRSGDRLAAGALAIIGLVSLYFFGLMATISATTINAMTGATAHPQMQPGRLDLTVTDAANHLLLGGGSRRAAGEPGGDRTRPERPQKIPGVRR